MPDRHSTPPIGGVEPPSGVPRHSMGPLDGLGVYWAAFGEKSPLRASVGQIGLCMSGQTTRESGQVVDMLIEIAAAMVFAGSGPAPLCKDSVRWAAENTRAVATWARPGLTKNELRVRAYDSVKVAVGYCRGNQKALRVLGAMGVQLTIQKWHLDVWGQR